jgi:hypothetical protein
MAERGYKAVLREIKCFLGIPDQAAHQSKYRCLVPTHNLGESRLPTGKRQCR